MLVSDYVTGVNDVLRGTDDTAPAAESTEWNYWVRTLNRKKRELYEDTTKLWSSTFKTSAPNETGTVTTAGTTTLTGSGTKFTDYRAGDKLLVSGETVRTIDAIASDTSLTVTVAFSTTASAQTFTRQTIIATGVQSYNLHRSFLAPSDRIYVLTTDSKKVYIDFIKPEERDTYNKEVYISGDNPKILTFDADIISTDQIVGGTLYVPGHYMPDDVSAETDTLPIPNGDWAVYACAAEIAGNDIVYEDKEANLNAKANNLYRLMVSKNRTGTYGNPRVTPTNVKRIRGTS